MPYFIIRLCDVSERRIAIEFLLLSVQFGVYLFYGRVFLSGRSRVSSATWRNLLNTALSKILFFTGNRLVGPYELASAVVYQIPEPCDLRDFPWNWRISRPDSRVTFNV